MIKLSDYVFQFVADRGVKHVFMLPGGGAMHLNNALGARTDIEYVNMLHEQACGVAAEAYARVKNDLGVALVTTGPGSTNAVSGVLCAWQDSTPCMFFSGQVKRSDLATGRGVRQYGVQEVDIVSIVSSITKYAVTIMEPESIRYHLEKAYCLAKSGRPGPVWIDVPLDVQAAMIDETSLRGFEPAELSLPTGDPEMSAKVAETLNLLKAAERPVILVGNGVRIAGAAEAFLAMAEKLGAAVLTTRLGVDLIPGDHPLCMGMPGGIASRAANFVLQNCDCLLALGTRLDMALIAYAPERLARDAKRIMVNIDKAEIDKLGAVINIGVACDAKAFINEMLAQAGHGVPADRPEWLARCHAWKTRYPFVTDAHRAEAGLSLYTFSEVLADELAEGDVVLPGSSGFAAEIFLTAFTAKAGQRVFHNKGTGSMGLCQPAAVGACLAAGRRRTVCVDGDGGFQMNIQELETVRRLQLPIKFFVINNRGYASIRASQANYFGRLTGADATSGLTLPDISKVAEAYELQSAVIADPAKMREQVRQLLASPDPVVCDVQVMPDEVRAPRVASVQRPDGSMVSRPLEDMWPFLDRAEFAENMIVPILPDE